MLGAPQVMMRRFETEQVIRGVVRGRYDKRALAESHAENCRIYADDDYQGAVNAENAVHRWCKTATNWRLIFPPVTARVAGEKGGGEC